MRRRLGLAALSGVLQFTAFPPLSASWTAFLAFIPLFWALADPPGPGEAPPGFRRQFLLGFTAGAVFFLATLHWILFLPNEEITIPGLMFPALLFLAGYLGIYSGLAAAAAGWGEQLVGGASAFLALPVFWTLCEYLRSLGTLAFPWGAIGYALAPHPAALQVSAWTGFWALSFWIVLVNGLGATALRAWISGARPSAWGHAVAAGAVLAAPLLFGLAVLRAHPPAEGEPTEGMRLALIQANTSREIKWKRGYESTVVEDLLRRTKEAADLDPDLIVWPETAAPVLILWNPTLSLEVSETVAALRRWVLVGTLDAVLKPGGGLDEYNAAILYNPRGVPAARYYKSHLLPFSEAMPFQKEIPWINTFNFGQSNFTAGREKNLFAIPSGRFSVLICFESIFPGMARAAVSGGAQVLVNITNDFWFGRSAGPVQHAEMAIHRAVENRTPLARCANSGVSFFVDAYGRTRQRTGLFVEALPVSRARLGQGGSFYTRHGDWFVAALAAVALLLLAQRARRLRVLRAGKTRGATAPGKGSHE